MRTKYAQLTNKIVSSIGIDPNRLDDPGYANQLAGEVEKSNQQLAAAKATLKHAKKIADNEVAQAEIYTELNKLGLNATDNINRQMAATVKTEAEHLSKEDLLKRKTSQQLAELRAKHGYQVTEQDLKHRQNLQLLLTKHQASKKDIHNSGREQLRGIQATKNQQLRATQFNNYLEGKTNSNPYQPGLFGGIGNFFSKVFG